MIIIFEIRIFRKRTAKNKVTNSNNTYTKYTVATMCFIKVNVIVFLYRNRIGGVMVSVLSSSAVDRGFESRSGQLLNWYLLLLL